MATSKIQVTEGSGKNMATHSISEDAVTKELQRTVPTDSSGNAIGGLALKEYDYVSRSLNDVTETWVFKTGGSGGTTVNTVVVVYTDSTLETISTVTKT